MLRGPVRLAQTALACVCTTALGRLVVPEVNMIPNGSMGSIGRRPSAAPEALVSANRPSKASKPTPVQPSAGASPPSSSVTAIHFRPRAASATMAANCGWVMAATAPVCSAK